MPASCQISVALLSTQDEEERHDLGIGITLSIADHRTRPSATRSSRGVTRPPENVGLAQPTLWPLTPRKTPWHLEAFIVQAAARFALAPPGDSALRGFVEGREHCCQPSGAHCPILASDPHLPSGPFPANISKEPVDFVCRPSCEAVGIEGKHLGSTPSGTVET